MAGAGGAALATAVTTAGGLGAQPCALLDADGVRAEVGAIRALTDRPFNLNFFCHRREGDRAASPSWLERLLPYFEELGIDPAAPLPDVDRAPFDDAACALVEELAPAVVSFHFGLPDPPLVERVRATGAVVASSATTVAEARWLVDHGADIVIAQGVEAGGHRAMFLATDVSTQIGTLALVPQVVDAVEVPVVAAGGIADARGVRAALALGAAAVQAGTAFLRTPEALISPIHRAALAGSEAADTAVTNVFTGRPARSIVNRLVREVGPLSADVAPFPLAAAPVAVLRQAAERAGVGDFTPLWSGQSAHLAREEAAADVVTRLAAGAV